MATLKHDAQGFLAGDPIDLTRALKDWDGIKADVRAIRNVVLGLGTNTSGTRKIQPSTPLPRTHSGGTARKSEPAAPRGTSRAQALAGDGAVRRVPQAATPTPRAAGASKVATASPSPAAVGAALREAKNSANRAPALPVGRDGRGRFVKRDGAEPNTELGDIDHGDGHGGHRGDGGSGALRELADRMVSAIKESGSSLEEVDPSVKAFSEVAQPMARGYQMLMGGEEKNQVSLLRRIYSSLTGLRRDESVFNQAANKSLKGIENKRTATADGAGSGGVLSLLGGLLSKIPGLPGAASLMSGAGGLLGGAGKAIMGAGKGLFRRIPLIGALLGGVDAATSIYDSETDNTLTRREKDTRDGGAVGSLAGGIGGMMAGAKLGSMVGAFAGPVGIAIGGAVGGAAGYFFGDQAGKIVGEKFGGWVSDLRSADIPGKLEAAWGTALEFMKSGWGAAIDKLAQAWDGIKGAGSKAADYVSSKADSANSFIKDKTGVDIKASAGEIKDKAVEVGSQAANGLKAGAAYVTENTSIGRGAVKAAEGVKAAGQGASVAAERAYNATAATAGSVLEAVMPKGYRHKALFDGIKGGDGLAKNGSYTDEEADKIRQLKTSGANTSPNLAGGMPQDIQDKIAAQAKKAGLDPVMMQKIAAMESGGNTNAISSTGATGIYQFTGQTASGVGIKNRFDADQNIEGGMKLAKLNQAALEKAGLPVTAENVYMMHQLGPQAALEVIRGAASGQSKADLSPETQKMMNFNYGANSKTAADYIATNKRALDDRYASVIAGAGGASTGQLTPDKAPSLATQQPVQIATPVTAQAPAPPKAPSITAQVAPVVAGVSIPSVPAAPVVPPVAEAPQIVAPLASNSARPQAVTASVKSDVGQDVRERGIAHIVTGGLSCG